jgi:hypothetical protein
VDVKSVVRGENELLLSQESPPLGVQVKVVGPQVGQLLITTDFPQGPLTMFQKEAEQVCGAYVKTWGSPVQFLSRDAAIHCLYSSVGVNHSFEYVWEKLLGQGAEDATLLGHKILGGGLRFVMSPEPDEQPEPTLREVKVESFLADPPKLFVAAHLTWPTPLNQDMFEKCGELLNRVEEYLTKEVVSFLTHKEN